MLESQVNTSRSSPLSLSELRSSIPPLKGFSILTGTTPGWLLKDASLVPYYGLCYFVMFYFPGDLLYQLLANSPLSGFYENIFFHLVDSVSRAGTTASYINNWRHAYIEYHSLKHRNEDLRIPLLPQIFIGTVSATFGGMWYRWIFIQPWTIPPYSFWVVCITSFCYILALDHSFYLSPFVGMTLSMVQYDIIVICTITMFLGFVLKGQVLPVWNFIASGLSFASNKATTTSKEKVKEKESVESSLIVNHEETKLNGLKQRKTTKSKN
ncbi:hypothetical protein HK096_011457 [Nowakowskiella sp. JEL0078]|nr:hypothetical protein HK096_011457 [Nowakowskiella sp. JEL0078]